MDHEHMNATPPSDAETGMADTELKARRRFLKGTTLALPAVMTLNSTAALATARASLTCADVPQTGCVHLKPAPDDFFREKVACYDKLTATTKTSGTTWTRNNLATYYQGLKCTDQTKCWRRVSDGSIVPDSELGLINWPGNPNAKPNQATCTPVNWQFAIVHFSASDGSVVGVGEPTTPIGCIMTSLSGSCLKSLWGKTI